MTTKHTVVVAYMTCAKVCIVEHNENATQEEIKQQALEVKNSSQFTEPWIPVEMDDDNHINKFEFHDLIPEIGMPDLLTDHELQEAMLDIEESKRVIEKPKRKYKRKKQENE